MNDIRRHMNLIEAAQRPTVIGPVYHGTNREFTRFEQQPRGATDPRRLGFYFTTNLRFAKAYGDRIIQANLHLHRVYDITEMTNREIIRALPLETFPKQVLMSGFGRINGEHYGLLEAAEAYGLVDALKAQGYDGIKYTEGYGDCYIAFDADSVEILEPADHLTETARLDEIGRPQTRQDADRVLRTAGYQRLGKGAFGAVYRKPGKPYVLKVFSAGDRPFLDFIALARAHQDNPHFPRFSGKVVRVTPDYYAIRMEPLTPYRYDETAITQYLKFGEDETEYMLYHPEMREACDLIIAHLRPKHKIDMKQSNLMMRGSTVVITDPVYDPDQIPDNPEVWSAVPDPESESPPVRPAADTGWKQKDQDLLDQLLANEDEETLKLLGLL